MRRLVPFIAVLLLSTFAAAQTAPSDSQTLRALLDEVRQLRKDLQTTTVAAQRIQVALYRLQLEDVAVGRISASLDDARSKLSALTEAHTRLSAEITHAEETRAHTQDPQERKAIEEELPRVKVRLEQLNAEEQQWQTKITDGENSLRAEQRKVEALHEVLDELDRSLQNVGRRLETSFGPK